MKYIRFINSSRLEDHAYTIVRTDNWTLPLSEHPSIVEHPDLFEIVDEDVPEYTDYLVYTG